MESLSKIARKTVTHLSHVRQAYAGVMAIREFGSVAGGDRLRRPSVRRETRRRLEA
jgi:hypothetical protein